MRVQTLAGVSQNKMDQSGLTNPKGFLVSLWDIWTRGHIVANDVLYCPHGHAPDWATGPW